MAIRYISDLHFGHSNIIRFDMRPFESTEEMDRELVKDGMMLLIKMTRFMCWAICFGRKQTKLFLFSKN